MTIKTTPHLNFRGQAREALSFYQAVFGGDLALVSYRDAGAVQNEAEADQIMWGQVAAGNGFRVMAYDVPAAQDHDPGLIPVYISIRGDDGPELKGLWEGLSEGAAIVQPLGPAGWSPLYGMLKDRFGVTWVLDMEPRRQG